MTTPTTLHLTCPECGHHCNIILPAVNAACPKCARVFRVAPKMNIRCYDNGGKTADRYTVVYMDHPERQPGLYSAVGMSAHPFHPQGFGQHTTAMCGRHLGKRITFVGLPEDCQALVKQDLIPAA